MKAIFIILIVIAVIWVVATAAIWLIQAIVKHETPKIKDFFVYLFAVPFLLVKLISGKK